MKKPVLVWSLVLSCICHFIVGSAVAAGLDVPHNGTNGIGCDSCHDVTAINQPKLMPLWTVPDPKQDRDDTQCNNLCWSCHNGVKVVTDYVTHSSLQTSERYGEWTVECWVCHTPHVQDQDNINGSTYGKLIRSHIRLENIIGTVPAKKGDKTVKFLGTTGPNSFADGDGLYDGICEVCHTKTSYFTNDGSGSAHFGSVAGTNCTDCHSHENGFAHGGGTGVGCEECHGHDAGYDDPDNGVVTGGKGTFQSHSTHTENDADDIKGPNLRCNVCHDTTQFPAFADGQATLAATTVCDACHSSGGTYDGLDDATVGAKKNWKGSVYDHAGGNPFTLQTGKEKWCATCHDESPSVIQTVSAPNVVGDEDGEYTYGTGWGYYKTGHGLEAGEQFPSKGGVETLSGRPLECDSCHDYATAHIDGLARTYDDGDAPVLDPAYYRQGYRLKLINGQEPMLMPRPRNTGNSTDHFRVCFQTGCHNDFAPFEDPDNTDTNFFSTGGLDGFRNRHESHVADNPHDEIFASDWSGNPNSRMTCVVCHNVHGSTRLAMVRDGKLTGREPGQQIWYKNDATTYIKPGSSEPPVPENLPLSASDGTAWNPASAVNLCAHCHPQNGQTAAEDRLPFQDVAQAPVLEWAGGTDLTADGVAPDSGPANSIFTFRVSYNDINNDSPNPIEVWVDLNDNVNYESGEKFAMTGTDTLDTNIVNGKIYTKSLAIAKAVGSDGILNYRFYASDGGLDASGEPTADSTLTVTNNSPVLTWTEESYFETDGVHPNIGGNGADYQFRVTFTDADGECPPDPNNGDIQVIVDGIAYNLDNNNGAACDTGRNYFTTIPVSSSSPPQDLTYRFTATDGIDVAVGNPTLDNTLTVQAGADNPPQLDWVTESCMTEGVKPALGLATAPFDFKVMYTDIEGTSPSSFEIWVDLNDNDTVDAGEKQTMSFDSGDGDYTNGEVYSYTWAFIEADAGVHKYAFFAKDTPGIDAVGEPTKTSGTRTVEVVSTAGAIGVRPGVGYTGPIWYNSIQEAIDAIDGAHTVLVYDGTYNEDIVLSGTNDSNTTLRSVCGPDATIINGSGINTTVRFARWSNNSQIDGFEVKGGTSGISVEGTQVTINNCQVRGNNGPNGGGISAYQSGDMPILTLTNSEIYNNSSDKGGGVYISRGTLAPGHIISNSIIRNNTITGDSMEDGGGGISLYGVPNITISNSVIRDNISDYPGGGLYVSQVPDPDFGVGDGLVISDSIISGNTCDSGGGGVYSNLSTIRFIRSSITGNTAAGNGGAIAHPGAGITTSFENCILADNHGALGGMAKLNGGTLDIINSTIANNQATSLGGAIYNQLATVTIRNSILWGNQTATFGHIASFNGGSMTITDSIIQGGDDGDFTNLPYFNGNVTPVVSGFASKEDPWFVGSGDYHIQAFSPAIDNAATTYAPDLDIDGQSRPDGAADIGADEYYP